MASIEFSGPKADDGWGGWTRRCVVGGVEYQVSVRRGKAVRIPYKPRGQNRGWKWDGAVYSGGRCLFSGHVPKSIGARGLLIEAGIEVQP